MSVACEVTRECCMVQPVVISPEPATASAGHLQCQGPDVG